MATFDFKEIAARAALDYIGPVFPLWWLKNGHKFNLPDLLNINAAQLLGNKYFLKLKLSHNGQNFELPNEPLISLGLSKTIVETATVGKYRKGTVKEYICTEDYQITIKGVCVKDDEPEVYPAQQVALINDMFEINDSLEVVSNVFFELFGIRKIVLKDKQFEDMAGEAGMQKYTITAVSDQDFYADLNEQDKNKTNLLG
jgi:hypothetical protein